VAKAVWGFLLQYGQFKMSSRAAALRFMRRHSDTYLANPYLEQALMFIETHDIPRHAPLLFRPAALRSGHMSVQSDGDRGADDLSDRIFAAYYALRRAGVQRRSSRIAAGLTASKVGASVGMHWVYADVNDRIKAHTRSQRRQLGKHARSDQDVDSLFEQHKVSRVDFWISSFRHAQSVGRGQRKRTNRERNTSRR